jgi:hypothetical protein
MLPAPVSGTVADFLVIGIVQVVDNKVFGDTGFEPLTSTVCKPHTKVRTEKKYGIFPVKRAEIRRLGFRDLSIFWLFFYISDGLKAQF